MKVNNIPKTYIYKANTGEAYEYVDQFNYKGKEKKDLVPGDDISIGTENFRVFYNKDGVIKAMPWYNIELKLDNPKQSETAGTIAFSSDNYWSKETGWNDSSKVTDGGVNIDMTIKNENAYKNNIQQYIEAYQKTLENMRVKEITVKACAKPELDSELGAELENQLTEYQKQNIRNPGQTGYFWIGSGHSEYAITVYGVGRLGNFSSEIYYNSYGVRPIIIIEY